MRLGTMLKDVIGALFQKPITQKYPFERTPVDLTAARQAGLGSGKMHRLRSVRERLPGECD